MFSITFTRRQQKEIFLFTLFTITIYSYFVLLMARTKVKITAQNDDAFLNLLEWHNKMKRNHVLIETKTVRNERGKILYRPLKKGLNTQVSDLGVISQDMSEVVQSINNIKLKVDLSHSAARNEAKLPQFSNIEKCVSSEHRYFPLCKGKKIYIKARLEVEDCFSKVHKLNTSKCSLYNYLTRIEPYCPGEPEIYKQRGSVANSELASQNINGLLEGLLAAEQYEWIRGRVNLLWSSWVTSLNSLNTIRSEGYTKKNVLVFFGAFTAAPEFFTYAGHGAPLGEMIQWADLVTSLYLLGHNVSLAKDLSELNVFINQSEKMMCPPVSAKNEADSFDVIYTDILGVWYLRKNLGGGRLAKYKCKLRILDSFGTFVEFNFPDYPYTIPGGRTGYGLLNLVPTQILTLYPHTHDNRFLGFVSFNMVANKTKGVVAEGRPKALLYAKQASYTKNYEEYLKIISEYFEIHATATNDNYELPPFIRNHGSVKQQEVQELLFDSSLFIGVGFPFEGPGPLEAMANGVPYLQPKYAVPISKLNHKFYGQKPTLRELNSQNPYMEEFIGEPYCFTINITDQILLRKTLEKIKDMKSLPPKIPREFTAGGFLERVHAYTDHLDFCDPYAPRWPPANHLQVRVGQSGDSCKDTCMKHGLVCERTYFDLTNNHTVFREHKIDCVKTKTLIILHAPSYKTNPNICYLQAHAQVFSCMHAEKGITRVCPCRDYEKEQSAICKGCL